MSEPNNPTAHYSMQHLSVLLNVYVCFLLLIVGSSNVLSQSQVSRDLSHLLITSNTFIPALSSTRSPKLQATTSPILATTTTFDQLLSSASSGGFHNSLTHTLPSQIQQQRSLKFTLIAGKYWKFHIKTNSLQIGHTEKELRLHRNLSSNNFIIDDDGWFQYNHQQQQLFAWPSYNTKPATYYFVLLPSGLDYEADGENVIKAGDIVANIVVELIEPYTTSKVDLDRLVDHKFSLEYLHRHSSYPLLLTQIVSIFDILSRSTLSSNGPASYLNATQSPITGATTTTAASTNTAVSTASQQNKQARSSTRLSEFLLIDAYSSQDGEFFSITWTTHPSLVNNSPLLPINNCRLSTINETISKLSSRSILYPNVDDKFVISYSLEGPLANSQAIIPTERGNYALKLTLNNICRRKKIVEELGIISAPGIFIGLAADVDDKENIILDQKENPPATPISLIPRTNSLVSNREESRISTREPSVPTLTQESNPSFVSSTTSDKQTKSTQDTATRHPFVSQASNTQQITTPLAGFSLHEQTPAIEFQHSMTTARRAHEIFTSQTFSSEVPASQFHSKSPPQAKSFVNFLETTESRLVPTTMAGPTDKSNLPSTFMIDNTTRSPTTVASVNETASISSSIKNGQESSLNDDLIGILNDTMDLLTDIAVPLSVILGIILIASILIAICSLCIKKRRSKQFEVGDRFKFRYGSERKGFLKNSSRPVILEADQKSLSMGGTPVRKPVEQRLTVKGTQKMPGTSEVKFSRNNKKGASEHKASGSDFFVPLTVYSSNCDSEANCD